MNSHPAKSLCSVVVVLIFVLIAHSVRAQQPGSTLSGTVTDPSGKAAANVKISARNIATNNSTEAQTDSSGYYIIPDLAPGDYEVSAATDGLNAALKVRVPSDPTANLTLAQQNLPNAPSIPKPNHLSKIWASPQRNRKPTQSAKPSSTSALIC